MISFFSHVGSASLVIAFSSALASFCFYLLGQKKKQTRLFQVGLRANFFTTLALTIAVFSLVSAFIVGDYQIEYVYLNSNETLPLYYKITGLWAALDGSLLFWVWLVGLYATYVAYQNHKRFPQWIAVINATMMVVILFFLAILLFANNPFGLHEKLVSDGKGLNPLLQNIAMTIHPPLLYLGFTGFSVPFAFVIAALVNRKVDATWIQATRRYTLVAWLFLTLGLLLGGAWAYVELGWGGFWAWDPVENAALLPWLTATAYLHSVLIQKRRGLLVVWNIVLVQLTFLLTIFGTYLTRSNIVTSVHSFSNSVLGPYFLSFMLAIILVCVYLNLTRYRSMKSQAKIENLFSKESAFLVNNLLLLFTVFIVIWGTLFEPLSEWITGDRVTVGIDFFNTILAPVGLSLLFLMGFGPMIAWRKATWANFRRNLLSPLISSVICLGIVWFLGIREAYVLITGGLTAFVLHTLVLEFYRGTKALRTSQKKSWVESFVLLFVKGNPRYGGYVVHLGVLLIFIGIAGLVFQTQKDFSVNSGQKFSLGGYDFLVEDIKIERDLQKEKLKAVVGVYQDQKRIDTLYPRRYFYFIHEQPTTEVDIHLALFKDVYLILGNIDPKTQRTDIRVMINPLISFVWLGGIVIALGILLVTLPRKNEIKSKTTSKNNSDENKIIQT